MAKPRPWMRVQLQRDDDPDCYDSILLHPVEPDSHVTVAQVEAALNALLLSPKLPGRERARALRARSRARRFVGGLPPGGWSREDGEVSAARSFTFDRTNCYQGFRFDIENLYGHNLRS